MSIDSAVDILWDVLKGAVTAIKRPIRYVMSSKSFADGLREELRNLENEADRVRILEIEATNNVRYFYGTFAEWKASFEKSSREAKELLDTFDEVSKTCCYGTLPDPKCRHRFSRKAEGKTEFIKQLAEKCSGFKEVDDISFRDPAPGNVTAPNPARREGTDVARSPTTMASGFSASTSIKLRDDDIFESRAQIIQDIKDALADHSNSVVGVHGMGGLGKSTLLKQVKSIITKEKSFDWVAMADVSANPDIKRIQGEIADYLGLDIKNEEFVSVRARRLCERLEAEGKQKVLIILDNLWEELKLKEVGIPCGPDNKVTGCKLLLTSRDRRVLIRKMGCDEDFLLRGLEEGEAKTLFEKLVGDKVHREEFKPLVDVALHKCAGVPFLIDAMAKRFKDADLSEWEDTLKKIEKFNDKETKDLIDQMLQWNYGKLEKEMQLLLQLCVVYGISKPSLENLVRYGVGLGLFRGVGSMKEARNRLVTNIRALQASSLLLDSEDVDSFKIHDLVREFVALVSLEDRPLLVLKDKVNPVIDLPKDKLNAICFPYADMEELPQELDYSELETFLLFTNKESLEVPNPLFYSMRKLMVLHLAGIRLTCSSSLFQFPEKLQTLSLDNCSLDNVAILGELKGLQILSFKGSNIQRLPKEIGQLVELRLLDLNYCSQLHIVEPDVLGSLIKLEELYMEKSFDKWNAVEQTPHTSASLIELNNMKKLCTLYVSILDPSVLPENLNVENLTKYKIRIGDTWRRSSYKGSSTLELKLDATGNILKKGCIQSILAKTDDLFLDGLNETKQSICTLSEKGFPKLKHLCIRNSPSTHYILQSPSPTDFKMLEWLLLEDLINLEKICNNNISPNSFGALKVVRVKSCDKMEVLFPLSSLRELPRLEEIEVSDCTLMHGIVELDDCGIVELHNLQVLKLHDLPNIKNFFAVETAPSSSISYNQVSTQSAFFNGQQ